MPSDSTRILLVYGLLIRVKHCYDCPVTSTCYVNDLMVNDIDEQNVDFMLSSYLADVELTENQRNS